MILASESQVDIREERGVRVAPLQADKWDEAVHAALRMMPEELTRSYLTFSFYLLTRSTVAPRLRELAVLRVAHLANCAYEWDEHVTIGKREGLSDDDIAALQRGEADDDFDRTILAAVDELVEQTKISDATWAALGEKFDTKQLMDFVFTVGGYHMLAMALNTFGVEPKKEN
jgi:AhpD family alkylhydroperoxidase